MKRTMTTKECNRKLQNRLVDKSIEAFLMGLEVFNKPTINYRTCILQNRSTQLCNIIIHSCVMKKAIV